MTVVLVVCGTLYLIVHGVELFLRAGSRVVGRDYEGLETRRHALRFFHSAMIVKGFLVLVQVGLLIAQAYTLSKTLRGILDNPSDFYDILRKDVIFLALLALLIVVQLVGSRRGPAGDV
jgi:hypothetical protein